MSSSETARHQQHIGPPGPGPVQGFWDTHSGMIVNKACDLTHACFKGSKHAASTLHLLKAAACAQGAPRRVFYGGMPPQQMQGMQGMPPQYMPRGGYPMGPGPYGPGRWGALLAPPLSAWEAQDSADRGSCRWLRHRKHGRHCRPELCRRLQDCSCAYTCPTQLCLTCYALQITARIQQHSACILQAMTFASESSRYTQPHLG